MIKKFSFLLLVVVALFLAACSKKEGGVQQTNLIMATGGTSGTYYPYGGAIAQSLSAAVQGVNINVQSTGASAANLRLIANDEVDLAIVQNDVMSYAYNGIESFENNQITGFSTIATLYAEVCQVIASPSSGINSIADLKGKKISVGDVGSGVESNARQILAVYGMTFDDIIVQNLGFGDSASALKDKKLDAFFVTAGTPTTAIMELSSTNPISIISIDDDIAQQLMSQYPFYTTYVIPVGTYRGIDSDVQTVAVKATLIANPFLDDQLVYEMTKALFENKEDIAAAHSKGSELAPSMAVQGVSVDFHAGARQYFEEIGAL
ncbi:MAG: TAXI family TRAP transporter solute-binding subunit [Treponemataceae bacterium]